MTYLQWAALVMMGGLAIFARRFPRLRAYMAASLGVSLAILGLHHIDVVKPYVGLDLAIVLSEGMLFMASPVALAWALRASWKAVAAFVWSTWVYVVLTWPNTSGERLMAYYLTVIATVHLYVVGHALWRASGRAEKCPEERALLILAAVGLSGTAFALLWGRDDWGIVSCGNVATYAILGGLHLRTHAQQS